MSKPPFSDLQRMVRELILPFYSIERATWLPQKFGRRENDAEHSWGLALMACALAPRIDPRLDIGLICQFATVHDLVEVYAGDTPNFAPEDYKATKDAREQEALAKLKHDYKDLPWIAETIVTYEEQLLPEAHFVRSLDKTLSLLQESSSDGRIFRDYKVTKEGLRSGLQQHRRKAMVHEDVFDYYEAAERELLDNPDLFYQEEK